MSWIKLDKNHYALEATPDPQEIVNIDELDQQITDLQTEVNSIKKIEYPAGANNDMKQAVDNWNKKQQENKDILLTQIRTYKDKRSEIIGN